jgi:hypothetical protein
MKKLFLLLLILTFGFSGCKTYPQISSPVVSISGPSSGNPNINYTFAPIISGGQAPYTYTWNYSVNGGSNLDIHSDTLVVKWISAGTYTVGLLATDSLSRTSTASLIITINPAVNPIPIKVNINGPTSGVTNTNYTYRISWSGGTPPYTYNWSNGGSLSGGGNPNASTSGYFTIQWSKAGTYTVSVTVRDSLSRAGSTNLSLAIKRKNVLPVAETFTDKYGDMYMITVEKFEKDLKVTNDWQQPKNGATIVGVFVNVKNEGKHFKMVFNSNFSLEDFTGYTYYYIAGFPIVANHTLFDMMNLAPKDEYEGWVFFEVPKTVLNGSFILIYDTGDYEENFNENTLQFKLN